MNLHFGDTQIKQVRKLVAQDLSLQDRAIPEHNYESEILRFKDSINPDYTVLVKKCSQYARGAYYEFKVTRTAAFDGGEVLIAFDKSNFMDGMKTILAILNFKRI